jgi:hypothetical protein
LRSGLFRDDSLDRPAYIKPDPRSRVQPIHFSEVASSDLLSVQVDSPIQAQILYQPDSALGEHVPLSRILPERDEVVTVRPSSDRKEHLQVAAYDPRSDNNRRWNVSRKPQQSDRRSFL